MDDDHIHSEDTAHLNEPHAASSSVNAGNYMRGINFIKTHYGQSYLNTLMQQFPKADLAVILSEFGEWDRTHGHGQQLTDAGYRGITEAIRDSGMSDTHKAHAIATLQQMLGSHH